MKKILLTTTAVLTILFTQAQIIPCDSLSVTGSQYQLTFTSVWVIDFWETTAPDGTILAQDSSWNSHLIYNGLAYDTITTCLYTMNSVCCVIYVWNGSDWVTPGNPSPSWDCDPNSLLGCYDPGTGLGQYLSFATCDTICGNSVTPSWECDQVTGCYDPGTGNGQYATLGACQSICTNPLQANWCDSTWYEAVFTDISGGLNTVFELELTGYITDSLNNAADTATHTFTTYQSSMLFSNYANIGSFPHSWTVNQILVTDTVTICWVPELYLNGLNSFPDTCSGLICEDWIFDMNTGLWAKTSSITSIGEINLDNNKLIKIVDILGRETFLKRNETLFYIFEDGTIEKKYIIE
jgi:hypothetical protein